MTLPNWPIVRAGTAATAVAAGVSVPLRSGSDPTRATAHDVLIDNPGPNDVWALAGDAAVQATTLCVRVPAGSLQPYRVGLSTHLSLCTAGSGLTQACVVHLGDGQ